MYLVVARAQIDGFVFHFFVAYCKHVVDLGQLGVSYLFSDRFGSLIDFNWKAGRFQLAVDLIRLGRWRSATVRILTCTGQIHRRELAGEVLDQNAKEPLNGAE